MHFVVNSPGYRDEASSRESTSIPDERPRDCAEPTDTLPPNIARSALNERIDTRGLGKSRFQGDGGESHLLYQKAKHPISEGHGFVSAMQGLSEGNDTRCAYDGLQWKQRWLGLVVPRLPGNSALTLKALLTHRLRGLLLIGYSSAR